MPWSPIGSGCALASSTVSAMPGHSGAIGANPACSRSSIQGCHEEACSQRPWMRTTGMRAWDMATPWGGTSRGSEGGYEAAVDRHAGAGDVREAIAGEQDDEVG